MTEVGRFFDAVLYSEGDQAEVQARWARDGVLAGYAGELAVSSGGASLVAVSSGEAFVQGFWYRNTATKTLAITANVGATPRVDRVVLHLDRVANTLVAIIHEGTVGGGTPALTQMDGGVWEISLATISTASGVSTITDARQWQSNVFNPMTTGGDIIIADAAGRPVRKAKGANGTFLGVDGTGNLNYSVPVGPGQITTPMLAANGASASSMAGMTPSTFVTNGAFQSVTWAAAQPQLTTVAGSQSITWTAFVRLSSGTVGSVISVYLGWNGSAVHEIGTFHWSVANYYYTFNGAITTSITPSTSYTMGVWVIGSAGYTINIFNGNGSMLEMRR